MIILKPNKDLVKYLSTKGLEVTYKENCSPHDSVIRLTNAMKDDEEIQRQRKRHLENLRKV